MDCSPSSIIKTLQQQLCGNAAIGIFNPTVGNTIGTIHVGNNLAKGINPLLHDYYLTQYLYNF